MPPDYEYQPLRLPPGTDRISAQVQLSIQAEFGGWELAGHRIYADGKRRVTVRRRLRPEPLPPLST